MSNFWTGWVFVLTLTCLGLIVWLLFATRRRQRPNLTEQTMGHSFDGIEEYDNPLPQWWFYLFVATIVFGAAYLVLFPGILPGKFNGILGLVAKDQYPDGWSSTMQYKNEVKHIDEQYGPIFDQYTKTPIPELAQNETAVTIGKRVFANNCAICHGSAAQGRFGFPNLSDNDWLYGHEATAIKTTLLEGRRGQMPAWGQFMSNQEVTNVSLYVRSLSGVDTKATEDQLAKGKENYIGKCSACHGVDGKGSYLNANISNDIGAPDLTDDIWLYGGAQHQVEYTIRNGRNGAMPAWKDVLGENRVHLVATYIYSLGQKAKQAESTTKTTQAK
ncbi:cytochrome-c oxidase, cbb3-type subunit III [Zooshikella sp. RANM57]|uniref:cytochrome-c oxidase, cbb3-type subunit III n=1 Tax=Zooshikella sp. RANM57 TaxID=3425863 RepID=UPI003D6DBA6B